MNRMWGTNIIYICMNLNYLPCSAWILLKERGIKQSLNVYKNEQQGSKSVIQQMKRLLNTGNKEVELE